MSSRLSTPFSSLKNNVICHYRRQSYFNAFYLQFPFLLYRYLMALFEWQEREEEWMNDIDARVQFAVDFGKQNRFLRDLSTFFSSWNYCICRLKRVLRIRIGFNFWWPKTFTTGKILTIFYQTLQYTYPCSSKEDVLATGEAFSPQKRISSCSKYEIFKNC